jgi:hypothetical protein
MRIEKPDLIAPFARGFLDRREFFRRFAFFIGGAAALPALSAPLESPFAFGQMTAKDDPRLVVGDIVYKGETEEFKAHFARPLGENLSNVYSAFIGRA